MATITGIKLSNGIFYEMDVVSVPLLDQSGNFDTTIPQWNDTTIANCDFMGNINAGNVIDFIRNLSKLELQKREQGQSEWITLMTIEKQNNIINPSFILYDSYCASGVMYEYALLPYDNDGNQGARLVRTVLSQFNKAFVCDAQYFFDITNDWQVGGVQTNQKTAVYEPYGAEFPFVAFNAKTKYRSGSSTAILLAPTSTQRSSSYLDRKAQIDLVDDFNSWLTNHRGKILKDFNGNIRLISVHESISNEYYKEMGNGLASTTFNWVEIGKFTQEYLKKNGMLENFPIIFT